MLRNTLIIASLFALLTIVMGGMMRGGPETRSGATNINATAPGPRQREGTEDGYRSMVVSPGPRGHYQVDATVNGRSFNLLVDTGASLVVLSRADAESVGIDLAALDYRGRVMTANGSVRFAPVTLDQFEIGEIVVDNLRAAVVETDLPTSLLGMSFLNRLSGFEVRNRQLILRY